MKSQSIYFGLCHRFATLPYRELSTFLIALLLISVPTVGVGDEPAFDQYGGLKAIKAEATGFFRLEQLDGRHFLVTPEGHGYRALGINHFHNMSSKDYDAVVEQVRSWGFNAGCYQGPRWMWKHYPYTKGINLVPVCVWKPDSQFTYKDVFDPGFLTELDSAIRRIVEPQSDNEMLIGYFWTDIPIWSRTRNGGWISFFKSLPEDSSGGTKWREWKATNANADESDFLVVIAKQLYAKGHESVRKYDENHLIFGDRYHEVDIPDAVVREALPFIDAIAIQPTSREFNFKFFDRLYEQYGKPIYIADHVSSFPTAAHPVTMGQAAKNPDEYGAYYRRYVTAALSRPYMIGYNKCQYQDQPTPTLLKQGMLDIHEQPYPVVERIREANLLALDHAYEGTEPKFETHKHPLIGKDGIQKGASLRITAPADGARFSAEDEIVIQATVDLDKFGGRQVRFYYLDEEKKWELIDHDATAPFEATWKSPPVGNWDIYVAVHGQDWTIVSKSHVTISVGKGSIVPTVDEPSTDGN